jgi:cell division protease FtsH
MKIESDKTSPLTKFVNNVKENVNFVFNKAYKFVHRQYKIDKLRFSLMMFLIALMSFVSVASSQAYFVQKAQYNDYVSKSKEITWRQYLDTLEKQPVKELQTNYYRTEFFPFGVNNGKKVYQIILNDGTNLSYVGDLDEEKSKLANKIIYDKNIVEKKLFIDHSDKSSAIGSMLGSLFFIMGLIILVIIAQRAFADVLVGKDFQLTRNNEDITFKDIIGYDEVKQEFEETVEKLKHYEKLQQRGIATPKGILLTGPPGVGKTMFAKALANEFGAGFLYATGSDFVELYVGTGARRVRSLFANARYMAPCVIFIDEVDALGTRGGYGMDSERLSTINQMLAEMDGMNENKAILVVAATNHQDKVDPALLRPGRFDKKINIPTPDIETREAILRFYNNKGNDNIVVAGEEPDFKRFARITAGMSGADLKNVIDEAKNVFMRANPSAEEIRISGTDLDEALEVILLGVMKNKSIPKEVDRVAVHELGHAVVGHSLQNNSHVQKISVSGRGMALGFTLQTPKEELRLLTPKELMSQITALLAGRAAEWVMLGDISSGAADDLQRANTIAQKMVCEWGMGKTVGMFATINNGMHNNNPHYNREKIENDINDILTECYEKACKLIELHKSWIEVKKALLLEKISLEHDELFSDYETYQIKELI